MSREHWWDEYKVSVPEGRNEHWAVERFVIPEKSLEGFRLAMAGRPAFPGTYTKLVRLRDGKPAIFGGPVMSDTPAEIGDLLPLFQRAKGRVLINGLGLGVALKGVLAKPEVTRVDVVEVSQELIDLVGPHYACPRLRIHHGDAFQWRPPKGAEWDVVWHDIWDDICSDNLRAMEKLHRKYARRCDWQGSWAKAECWRQLRRG